MEFVRLKIVGWAGGGWQADGSRATWHQQPAMVLKTLKEKERGQVQVESGQPNDAREPARSAPIATLPRYHLRTPTAASEKLRGASMVLN